MRKKQGTLEYRTEGGQLTYRDPQREQMNHASMVYKNKEQVKEMGDQGMKIKGRGGASIMISSHHDIRISNKSILSLKVEAVQGKHVSLEWTDTSGGLWEWWQDPEVPLAFPVESACS